MANYQTAGSLGLPQPLPAIDAAMAALSPQAARRFIDKWEAMTWASAARHGGLELAPGQHYRLDAPLEWEDAARQLRNLCLEPIEYTAHGPEDLGHAESVLRYSRHWSRRRKVAVATEILLGKLVDTIARKHRLTHRIVSTWAAAAFACWVRRLSEAPQPLKHIEQDAAAVELAVAALGTDIDATFSQKWQSVRPTIFLPHLAALDVADRTGLPLAAIVHWRTAVKTFLRFLLAAPPPPFVRARELEFRWVPGHVALHPGSPLDERRAHTTACPQCGVPIVAHEGLPHRRRTHGNWCPDCVIDRSAPRIAESTARCPHDRCGSEAWSRRTPTAYLARRPLGLSADPTWLKYTDETCTRCDRPFLARRVLTAPIIRWRAHCPRCGSPSFRVRYYSEWLHTSGEPPHWDPYDVVECTQCLTETPIAKPAVEVLALMSRERRGRATLLRTLYANRDRIQHPWKSGGAQALIDVTSDYLTAHRVDFVELNLALLLLANAHAYPRMTAKIDGRPAHRAVVALRRHADRQVPLPDQVPGIADHGVSTWDWLRRTRPRTPRSVVDRVHLEIRRAPSDTYVTLMTPRPNQLGPRRRGKR